MRIRDGSSDVCSSDRRGRGGVLDDAADGRESLVGSDPRGDDRAHGHLPLAWRARRAVDGGQPDRDGARHFAPRLWHAFFKGLRSEEHTSELQSLMRISYAVFCLNKKKHNTNKCYTHIMSSQ